MMKKIKRPGMKKNNSSNKYLLDKYIDNKYINIANNNEYIENINSKFIFNLKSTIYCNEKSTVGLTDMYYFSDEIINLGSIKITQLPYDREEIINNFNQGFINKYNDLETLSALIINENQLFTTSLKIYLKSLKNTNDMWLLGHDVRHYHTNDDDKKEVLLGSIDLHLKYLNQAYNILNVDDFKKVNFILEKKAISLNMTVVNMCNKIMSDFAFLASNQSKDENYLVLKACKDKINNLKADIEKIETLIYKDYLKSDVQSIDLVIRNGINIEEFKNIFSNIEKCTIKILINHIILEFNNKVQIDLSDNFVKYFNYEKKQKTFKIYCGEKIELKDKIRINTNIISDNLLRIVKLNSNAFENSHVNYNTPYYKNINKTCINSIEIELKDSDNNLVKFTRPPSLTLHFKNIRI